MINKTILLEEIGKRTTESDILIYLSNNIYLPSVAFYWVFQFILTMIVGYALVKEDKGKFFAIFIFTQLIGAIVLFLIFVYPVIPGIIDKIFT